MGLSVEVLHSVDEVGESKWNNFVDQSRLASFFHRYGWLKAYEEGTSSKPRHIVAYKSGALVAGFPNFIEKIPRTPFNRLSSIRPNHGGPLILTDEAEILSLFHREISNVCGGRVVSHRIMSSEHGNVRYGANLKRRGYRVDVDNCVFRISLDRSWEEVMAGMGNERRYDLRKGKESDYRIVDEEINEENAMRFYSAYTNIIAKVGGIPQPPGLFRAVTKYMSDNTKLFTIESDGSYLGGFIHFLDERNRTILATFSSVDNTPFKYATELLHEYSMRWGKENGYLLYDFGGTPSDFEDSLFRSKDKYGGGVVPSFGWEKGFSTLGWAALRLGMYLNRKLTRKRTRGVTADAGGVSNRR